MIVIVSPELTPQYFTKSYQLEVKKTWFDAWYRGIKAANQNWVFDGLLKINTEFMNENPDYSEGCLCGKIKK